MKKIICCLIALFSFTLFSCGKEKKCQSIENECQVKLKNIKCPNYEESKKLDFDIKEGSEYQYVVLENDDLFTITINLENEKDYHILDVNFICDDKELKVYIDSSFVYLTSLGSINWKGDTNKSFTLSFMSNNDEFLTTLKIEKILYIDREESSTTYNADVSKNNEVDIYKINSASINVTGINENGLEYDILCNDNHLSKIYNNSQELQLNTKYYSENEETFKVIYELENGITYTQTINYDFNCNQLILINFEIYPDHKILIRTDYDFMKKYTFNIIGYLNGNQLFLSNDCEYDIEYSFSNFDFFKIIVNGYTYEQSAVII